MEVAGQWRREWAGSAEYGKVTEGGVTRRVARALEVLQSSGPGSRMRVLRAAYHSTAGPGAPSQSFMMHSSRRVISSGSSFLESPTFMASSIMSKPLEISSTPLESTPERFSDGENYKVTEPDDSEISEPSKWRGSTGTSSVRMPSEESSSTDNASIIDLSKHTNGYRKSSFDSDSSDLLPKPSYRKNPRTSPLLDTPVTLSTLKYKSLLNGTNDSWNDRRKSYSFEDTSPLNETILHKNDTLAMESSTDSGICKSTEIVNENTEDRFPPRHFDRNETIYEGREETFKDWLAKNRFRQYKETPLKPHRENYVTEDPIEKIALQSTGKVSIALPMDNQTDDKFQYTKNHINSEDRRIKRVEFCKTELHFAAESGRVNIIATDEKPPPSNDFRRRKSAFVPIKGAFDKSPITLYGDKIRDVSDEFSHIDDEHDENNSTTKSILKNKIPKPKPYLLGENMTLGLETTEADERLSSKREYIIPTAVALINNQLHPDNSYSGETTSRFDSHTQSSFADFSVNVTSNTSRTTRDGPSFDIPEENDESNYFRRLKAERNSIQDEIQKFHNEVIERNNTNSIKQKLRNLQTSPIMQRSPKTRQLRDSDLTYFGIDNSPPKQRDPSPAKKHREQRASSPVKKQRDSSPPKRRTTNKYDNRSTPIQSKSNDLQSVKLIQRISNSVCNSEAESEDTPEYQNIPIKTNFAPVPIPRARTKILTDFSTDSNDDYTESERVVILKPIIEQRYEVPETRVEQDTRRSKYRRQDMVSTGSMSRSISEPPKYRQNTLSLEKPVRDSSQRRASNTTVTSSKTKNSFTHLHTEENGIKTSNKQDTIIEDEPPLYVNIDEKNIYDQPARSPKKLEYHSNDSQQRKQKREKASSTYKSLDEQGSKGSLPSKSSKNTNSFDRSSVINKSGRDKDRRILHETTSSLHKDRKRTEVTSADKPGNKEHKVVDKHTSEGKQHRHRHRTEHDNSAKNSLEKCKEEKYDSVGKLKHSGKIETENKLYDKHNSKRRDRSRSKDNNDTKPDIVTSSDRQHKTKKTNVSESDTSLKLDKSRRREYVINYDDKNGTVSSICQLKPGSPKKKIIHPEKTKEIKLKTKSSDKNSLLQYQEPQWMLYAANNGKRKWRTNVHQRTCTIL